MSYTDLTVRFLVLETNTIVDKPFTNFIECKKFVNKMKRSKKCRLISYPNFYT